MPFWNLRTVLCGALAASFAVPAQAELFRRRPFFRSAPRDQYSQPPQRQNYHPPAQDPDQDSQMQPSPDFQPDYSLHSNNPGMNPGNNGPYQVRPEAPPAPRPFDQIAFQFMQVRDAFERGAVTSQTLQCASRQGGNQSADPQPYSMGLEADRSGARRLVFRLSGVNPIVPSDYEKNSAPLYTLNTEGTELGGRSNSDVLYRTKFDRQSKTVLLWIAKGNSEWMCRGLATVGAGTNSTMPQAPPASPTNTSVPPSDDEGRGYFGDLSKQLPPELKKYENLVKNWGTAGFDRTYQGEVKKLKEEISQANPKLDPTKIRIAPQRKYGDTSFIVFDREASDPDANQYIFNGKTAKLFQIPPKAMGIPNKLTMQGKYLDGAKTSINGENFVVKAPRVMTGNGDGTWTLLDPSGKPRYYLRTDWSSSASYKYYMTKAEDQNGPQAQIDVDFDKSKD